MKEINTFNGSAYSERAALIMMTLKFFAKLHGTI